MKQIYNNPKFLEARSLKNTLALKVIISKIRNPLYFRLNPVGSSRYSSRSMRTRNGWRPLSSKISTSRIITLNPFQLTSEVCDVICTVTNCDIIQTLILKHRQSPVFSFLSVYHKSRKFIGKKRFLI